MTRITIAAATALSATLLCPVSAPGQERQGPAASTERARPLAGAVEPEVTRQLELQIAPSSAHAELTRQQPAAATPVQPGLAHGALIGAAAAEPRLTLDLTAIRERVGGVEDVRVWEGAGSATALSDAAERFSFGRGQILTVRRERPPAVAVSERGVRAVSSPTVLYTLDGSGRARELGLVHQTAGLHWLPDRGRFGGDLLIGLIDREDERAVEDLDPPVTVQLLAARDTVAPTQIVLDRIGPPFQLAAVDVVGPEDPFRVELISQVDPDLPPAELRVHRPRLAIGAPARLQGFGVEEARVTVTSTGAPLVAGQTITLALDRGWLADRSVVVDDRGVASTRIRSIGLGAATLELGPGPYQADPRTVAFVPPWGWAIATLLGGALGATLFVYRLRGKAAGKRRYAIDWIVGLIVGFGATTMAYAGMRLPEWIPVPDLLVGEVVPFALAFVCAAAGSALIHAITGATAKGAPAG